MTNTGNAILGISLIFACTIIGASLVFIFKNKEISPKLNQVFTGLAAGIMLSAAFFSLLLPAIESEISYMPVWAVVGLATAIGAVFLWGIDKIVPHFHAGDKKEEGIKTLSLSRTGSDVYIFQSSWSDTGRYVIYCIDNRLNAGLVHWKY